MAKPIRMYPKSLITITLRGW